MYIYLYIYILYYYIIILLESSTGNQGLPFNYWEM